MLDSLSKMTIIIIMNIIMKKLIIMSLLLLSLELFSQTKSVVIINSNGFFVTIY